MTINSNVIAQLELERDKNKSEMTRIASTPLAHKRDMSSGETQKFQALADENVILSERIAELREQDSRDETAAQTIRSYGTGFGAGLQGGYVNDAAVYTPESRNSYFLDTYRATQGDSGARERLDRNLMQRSQSRAISTTTGAGGEFVPPLWLEDKWIALARAGRTTTNLLNQLPLPAGTDLVNIPKVNSGTAVALQGTQNTAVTQVDMTTTSVSSGVFTVAGGQTIAMQLVEQSPGNADQIILKDLAQDYNRQIGSMSINSTTGGGAFNGLLASVGTTTAYTDASPTLMGPGKLYAMIAKAKSIIETQLYLPPNAIVMSPRRWDWLASLTDTANRAVILPQQGGPLNASALQTSTDAQGSVGMMLGIPVYIDPQIPINTGTGTNQDPILVLRTDETWFWEGNLRLEAFPQTYAQNLSLFVRVYNYVAQVTRRNASIGVINGTGLVTPTF